MVARLRNGRHVMRVAKGGFRALLGNGTMTRKRRTIMRDDKIIYMRDVIEYGTMRHVFQH